MKFMLALLVSIILVGGCMSLPNEPQEPPSLTFVSSEWSNPTRLDVNDMNWEDGVYISGDGNNLYFTYYPGKDLLVDVARGTFVDDLDVYVSTKTVDGQFIAKEPFDKFFIFEDTWSSGGMMISSNGDVYYHSNRDYINDKNSDDDIFRNEKRLAFNDDRWFGNPHYCAATDELYFDRKDTEIFMLGDAVATDFTGQPELLDVPINRKGTTSFQPFLTTDCQTMYFSSDRTGKGPAIYMTKRTAQGWSEPQLVIAGQIGAAEPTLTDDGQFLFFLHLFSNGKGGYSTDIFSVERNNV